METTTPTHATRRLLTAAVVLLCLVALLQLAIIFQHQIHPSTTAQKRHSPSLSVADRIRSWFIPRQAARTQAPATPIWEHSDEIEQMHAQINRMFDHAFREVTPIPSKTPAAVSNTTTSGSSAFLFPARDIHRIQQQIDALFAGAMADMRRWPVGFEEGWNTIDLTPSMTVEEGPDAYEIALHIPNMAKPDIQVSMEGNILSVVAQQQTTAAAQAVKTTNVAWQAQRASRFERRIRLPRATGDVDAIRAVYENDILHITVPKADAPELTPSRIRVI